MSGALPKKEAMEACAMLITRFYVKNKKNAQAYCP
jgi:hypothetical protein